MNSPSDFLTMWQHNRVFPDPKDGLQGDRGFLEIQAKELNKIFISDATEGYGFLNHTKELMKDINPKKLYPISDGFLYKDKRSILYVGSEIYLRLMVVKDDNGVSRFIFI